MHHPVPGHVLVPLELGLEAVRLGDDVDVPAVPPAVLVQRVHGALLPRAVVPHLRLLRGHKGPADEVVHPLGPAEHGHPQIEEVLAPVRADHHGLGPGGSGGRGGVWHDAMV